MAKRIIHKDFESFSESDLKKVGAYRYANDPSTEILMCALAEGDEEPVLWLPPQYCTPELYSSDRAIELMESLSDPEVEIHAFNSEFESALTQAKFEEQTGFAAPHPDQYRCSAAMCRRAAIRSNLADAAADLRLVERKDASGKNYINIFCKPVTTKAGTRRIMPLEQPEDFAAFGRYCMQDVRSERAVDAKLFKFRLTGFPLDTFMFTAKMNRRGLPVNVPGLERALKIIHQEGAAITEEFAAFVGMRPTQIKKFLPWLKARGYTGANLKAETIETFLEEVEDGEREASEEVIEALKLKQFISYAATSKVQAMLNCANEDGRVRGAFLDHGARTGRWTAKYVQPHNFKRPTALDVRDAWSEQHPEVSKQQVAKLFGPQTSFVAYKAICDGMDREAVKHLFGPPLEVISSCIRHFIQLPRGKMFDADYASIEARVVCWLAGQEDALEKFRNNDPIYEDMASYIFGIPIEKITKKGLHRFIGKQTVLGCGFQMGAPKFQKTCANYGQKIDLELAERAVAGYREKYDKVKALWYATERAAKNAINVPNKMFTAGKLRFFSTHTAGMKYLVMKLPSDRLIAYPDPRINEEGKISFYGLIKGKVWGRLSTYGGKLVENGTQAVAADVMANGSIKAECAGYEIFALIHDEALSSIKRGQTVEEFARHLKDLPAWAAGLPIEVEAEEVEVYTK